MNKEPVVWAFDLGKGSIGEAVRQGTKIPHKASLLIPPDFAENKKGAKACARPDHEVTWCAGIVLPENWTGGLDGESNETTIPSSEIYETTS